MYSVFLIDLPEPVRFTSDVKQTTSVLSATSWCTAVPEPTRRSNVFPKDIPSRTKFQKATSAQSNASPRPEHQPRSLSSPKHIATCIRTQHPYLSPVLPTFTFFVWKGFLPSPLFVPSTSASPSLFPQQSLFGRSCACADVDEKGMRWHNRFFAYTPTRLS